MYSIAFTDSGVLEASLWASDESEQATATTEEDEEEELDEEEEPDEDEEFFLVRGRRDGISNGTCSISVMHRGAALARHSIIHSSNFGENADHGEAQVAVGTKPSMPSTSLQEAVLTAISASSLDAPSA